MYTYLADGVPVYFVDELNNLGALVRDVRPTIMTVVPRLMEKIHSTMRTTIEKEKGIKKIIGLAAMKRAGEKEISEPFHGVKDYLYRKLVYSKFSKALGGKFRIIVSGSATLSKEIGRFFVNIGVPLYEGYGLTEASPVISTNLPEMRKLGTVGRAFPSVKIKINSDSEILAKGPNIMKGYRNNAEETKLALDSEGYLHTGDLGELDDEGYLTILGRKKELMKKSTGEYVPPLPIEQALKKLDIIDEVVVIAEARKFVSCLIFPNMEVVNRMRLKAGFDKITTEEFSDSEYIRSRINEHINEMNKHLHHTEEVQKFAIIKAPISIETGELTPTLKLRRYIIEEKYKKEIDAMYPGLKEVFMKERIAIIDGYRTPMDKAGGKLAGISADDLVVPVIRELMLRTGINGIEVDEVILGNIAQPATATNISRVSAMKAGIPKSVPAYTVHRNCASGMESITTAANKILAGEAKVIIAGGTESMSNIPLLFNNLMTRFFTDLTKAKTAAGKLKVMLSFRPRYLKPDIAVIQDLLILSAD